MSIPLPLYPIATFPNGIPFDLQITLTVPNKNTEIAIKQVDLKGNELFLLCQIVQPKGLGMCLIGQARSQLTVILPHEMNANDLKIHKYVLGKNWTWSEQSDGDLNFIKNKNEYQNKLFEI